MFVENFNFNMLTESEGYTQEDYEADIAEAWDFHDYGMGSARDNYEVEKEDYPDAK